MKQNIIWRDGVMKGKERKEIKEFVLRFCRNFIYVHESHKNVIYKSSTN